MIRDASHPPSCGFIYLLIFFFFLVRSLHLLLRWVFAPTFWRFVIFSVVRLYAVVIFMFRAKPFLIFVPTVWTITTSTIDWNAYRTEMFSSKSIGYWHQTNEIQRIKIQTNIQRNAIIHLTADTMLLCIFIIIIIDGGDGGDNSIEIIEWIMHNEHLHKKKKNALFNCATNRFQYPNKSTHFLNPFFFFTSLSLSISLFLFLKYKIKREIARNVSKQTKCNERMYKRNETIRKKK